MDWIEYQVWVAKVADGELGLVGKLIIGCIRVVVEKEWG